jgi:N-terminal domain of anti-restriction factor ArdC
MCLHVGIEGSRYVQHLKFSGSNGKIDVNVRPILQTVEIGKDGGRDADERRHGLLWHAADVRAYPTHAWLTYQQAQKAGAQMRKGEKATTVVFTKKLHIKDKETDEDKQIGMLRTFSVFNVAQIDGLESQPTPEFG